MGRKVKGVKVIYYYTFINYHQGVSRREGSNGDALIPPKEVLCSRAEVNVVQINGRDDSQNSFKSVSLVLPNAEKQQNYLGGGYAIIIL